MSITRVSAVSFAQMIVVFFSDGIPIDPDFCLVHASRRSMGRRRRMGSVEVLKSLILVGAWSHVRFDD